MDGWQLVICRYPIMILGWEIEHMYVRREEMTVISKTNSVLRIENRYMEFLLMLNLPTRASSF